MNLIDVTPSCVGKRPAVEDTLTLPGSPSAKQQKLEPIDTFSASLSNLSSIENDHCYYSPPVAYTETVPSAEDFSKLLPVGAQEELESELERFLDDWDNLPYDSDDDDGEFLRSLMSSPIGTTDNTSVHGSEGYGTDTSDLGDIVNSTLPAKDAETSSVPSILEEVLPVKSKDSSSTDTNTDNKSTPAVFQAHSLIRCQPAKTTTPKASPLIFLNKNCVKAKPGLTRVYHIPKLDSSQTSKVETKKRKTVLLRVIRPSKSVTSLHQNLNNNNINMSRANMKMEMERARALQEDKQSQEKRQSNQFTTAKSSATSSINFPSISISTPQLPSAILKVETGLQNPTQYHVRETQRNQVREYLSQSHDGTKYVVRQLLNPGTQSSAPTGGAGDAVHGSTPASPMARLNLSADSVDNIVDDIVSIESSMGDEHFRYDRTASTLPTISPGQLDSFALGSSQKLNVVRKEQTSSSYPLVKRELTDDEIRHFTKDRIKKDNHNIIERRRRYNINDRIKELGHMVPKSLDPDVRWNKGSILKAAVDYIHTLKSEQQRNRQVEQRAKQMESMNKKLLLRVQELEMMVQQTGIPLSSDQGEKESMVQALLADSASPTRDLNFTKEQELQVSSFPSNPVTPPSHSPILVTSPPGTAGDHPVMVFQPGQHHTPVGSHEQQQPHMGQNQLLVESSSFAELQQLNQQQQQQQQQQLLNVSPVATFHSHSPIPHDSMGMATQQQQQQQVDQMSSGVLNFPEMEIPALSYDPSAPPDIDALMGNSDFSALLNDNTQYSDVMMDEMIKDDIFLSDANNPTSLNQ